MISINDLHMNATPKLIFMANSLMSKGRSNKTYTIDLVNDGYNDTLLGGVFTSRAHRQPKIEATYTVEGVVMRGLLVVDQIGKYRATGVFISGNGKLWEAMANKNIRDYDWTDWNHTLTYTNVINSESASSRYIYDLIDRGKFKQDGGLAVSQIDITERYPALSVSKLIREVLKQEGYDVEFTAVAGLENELAKAFWIFMGDKDIRNSNDWLKSSIFEATSQGEYYEDTGTGVGAFSIDERMRFPTEVTDNGNNFSGSTSTASTANRYVIPETGTYRFVSPYFLQFRRQPDDLAMSFEDCQIHIYNNGSPIYSETITVSYDLVGIYNASGTLDCKYTEFQAGDIVTVHIVYTGAVDDARAWGIRITQTAGCKFYNDVIRWYGAGSAVDMKKVLPDMSALELFGTMFNYLNLYSFLSEETKTLYVRHGRVLAPVIDQISLESVSEVIKEPADWKIKFDTDKAEPPDDIYLDLGGSVDNTVEFKLSRTLVDAAFRIFEEVTTTLPILWDDMNTTPTLWEQRYSPPEYKTKGNARILRYNGQKAVNNYYLTYGGDVSYNVNGRKYIPEFTEVDVQAYHQYDLSLQGTTITGTARIPVYKLYDRSMFMSPVWVNGFGVCWLESAEQLAGDLYKVTLIQ